MKLEFFPYLPWGSLRRSIWWHGVRHPMDTSYLLALFALSFSFLSFLPLSSLLLSRVQERSEAQVAGYQCGLSSSSWLNLHIFCLWFGYFCCSLSDSFWLVLSHRKIRHPFVCFFRSFVNQSFNYATCRRLHHSFVAPPYCLLLSLVWQSFSPLPTNHECGAPLFILRNPPTARPNVPHQLIPIDH